MYDDLMLKDCPKVGQGEPHPAHQWDTHTATGGTQPVWCQGIDTASATTERR